MRLLPLIGLLAATVGLAGSEADLIFGEWRSHDRFAAQESPIVITATTLSSPQCKSAKYSVLSDVVAETHWYFKAATRVVVIKLDPSACAPAYAYAQIAIPVQRGDRDEAVISNNPRFRDGNIDFGGSSLFLRFVPPNTSLERTRER